MMNGSSEPASIPPPTDTSFAREVLDILIETLVAHGTEGRARIVLERSNLFGRFCSEVEGIQKYLKSLNVNRVQQRAVLRVGMELLHKFLLKGVPTRWDKKNRYLVKAPLPVGSREMMIFIHYLPVVLDRAFPGYSKLGILYMIARQKQGIHHVWDER